MIKLAIRLTLYGLIALLMPLLVHAEEIDTKGETKIEQKEEKENNTKYVEPTNPSDSCEDYSILYNYYSKDTFQGILNNDGTINSLNDQYNVTNYIKINSNSEINITSTQFNYSKYCLYDGNKNYISCNNIESNNVNVQTGNAVYIRMQYYKFYNLTINYTYCLNMEEETMIKTQNIEKLLIIGVGILIAIFLTRRN